MDKVKGSMEVLSSLQLTKDMAGMDAETKALLRHKEVLAVILQGVVAEYKGYSREEIMRLIEADSISDSVEASLGRTNTKLEGDSVEDVERLSKDMDLPFSEALKKEVKRVSGLGESIFQEGKTESKAESILELLEEHGKVPDELRQMITAEHDMDRLRSWLKLAAKSGSMEEFQKRICE